MPNPPFRHALREYVKTRLLEQTDAENRVFNARLYRYITAQDNLPMINILTGVERQVSIYATAPSMQVWVELPLEIECIITAPSGMEYGERLDRLCEQAEKRIDYFLGDLVNSCIYASTQPVYNEDGEIPIAAAVITYTVKYLKDEQGLPIFSELPDFLRCYFDWDMANPSLPGGGPDGQIDAQDRLTLPGA